MARNTVARADPDLSVRSERGASRPRPQRTSDPVATALVAFQRAAGNRALTRLLDSRRAGSALASRIAVRPSQRRLARRRTFKGVDLFSLLSDAEKSGDAGALGAGFDRMWRRVWAYVNDPNTRAERAARHLPAADPEDVTFLVFTKMKKADFEKKHPTTTIAEQIDYSKTFGDAIDAFKRLPLSLRASLLVDALVAVYPELKITSTDVTPSKLSAPELEKVKMTAKEADKIFAKIAGGTEDESVKQVFGAKNVATAKKKYAAAQKIMDKLVKSGDIVTDRSGYTTEMGEAGSTGPGGPISLTPSTIEDAGSVASVSTLIHESLHAASRDVRDKGYIDTPGFTTDPEPLKLTNAAHFEVVPRRIMAKDRGVTVRFSFPGETFTPAPPGTRGSAGAATEAAKQANDMLEMAWNVASMLHTAVYLLAYNDPGYWDLKIRGISHSDFVPYWSKVEKLTIHERLGHIKSTAHAGFHEATAPVTEIDLALSEELVRNIGDTTTFVPDNDEALAKLVTAAKIPDAVAKDRMSTVEKRRDLIIELVCGVRMGGLTGTGARDLRVIRALAETGRDWSKIQKKRPPADFAD